MKFLCTLIFFATISTTAIAQTADEVISRFIEATGGKDKLSSITSLQYSQNVKFNSPFGELDIPMNYYKVAKKLFRLETSLQFGGQAMNFVTVITDTAGYNKLPSNPMMGLEGGLKKMSAKDHAIELANLDAAGYFSSLVDYAAKGHKVELLKDEKVNKEECYKIKHTLATGQEVIYLINKSTNLVVRSDAKGAMAASQTGMGSLMNSMGGGRADKMEVSTLYADYQDFDGIKIPVKLTVKSPMGDLQSSISNVQINKSINPALYIAE